MEKKSPPLNIPELTKLLYKIVIQFGFYTQKNSPEINTYLKILTSALKEGRELTQLSPDLLSLSKVLARLNRPKAETLQDKTLLDYLTYQAQHSDNPGYQALIDNLEANRISSEQQLFNTVMQLDASPQTGNPFKNFPAIRIVHLLDAINVPAKFQNPWSVLRQQFDSEELTASAFNKIIDKTIALCSSIKAHAIDEQQQFDNFLFAITQHINTIEDTAERASAENKLSMMNRGLFSAALNSEMAHIQTKANTASELKDLQNSINQSLEKLSSQIQNHQTTEDKRQQELHDQLKQITEKLQHTEAESVMLRSKLQATHKLAYLDQLTGIANRLAYDERAELEILRWQRYKNPLSIVVWDIDYFKKINDHYGHKSGDKALALIAHIIANNCRKTDFVARYGGEEFVMLLPNTSGENAVIAVNKIRAIIENTDFKARGDTLSIQVSAGVHQFTLDDTTDSAFEQADQALYLAKSNGRNQCVLWGGR